MSHSATISIGKNRGTPRIYLQGRWLGQAGFEPGTHIHVDIRHNLITIEEDVAGDRTVSGKKDGTIPVIDLETSKLTEAFANADRVVVSAGHNHITITPAYTAVLMSGRELAATEASLFSGGGILSLAAKLCGFTPKLAVEWTEAYSEIYETNHPTATMYNMSVSDVPYGEFERFKPIGLFTAGIPCEPFSKIRSLNRGGQEKRDRDLVPEAHELGDMTFWALRAIEALNPHTVVLEEVPGFLDSGAGHILLNVLHRLYRYVEGRVLSPLDYGALTGRKRAVIVAQDLPINWPIEKQSVRKLGDILDPESHDWFDSSTKGWLFDHWSKQTAKGNGFASQVYTADSNHIGTIKKRYFAQQGDNPVIAHPTKPDTFRWLTLNEIKRLHGIPDSYYLGDAKTRAGEVVGQGVSVDLFREVIASITKE